MKKDTNNQEKGVSSSGNEQQMRRKTDIDVSQLILNPFSQELYIEATVRLDSEAKVTDEQGNEIPASSTIEKALTTKVYKTAATRQQAMNLSATALKMFVLIQYELQTNCDWIDLSPNWYAEVGGKGSSRNSHKKGVDELMRYGYITPTKFKNVYWVNPRLIFAGNRVEKYPNNVVVKNVYTGKSKPKIKHRTVEQEKSGMKLVKKSRQQIEKQEFEELNNIKPAVV